MNLVEAITRIQNDPNWGIWADTPFTPYSEARYGQRRFEQGGVLDDKSFFASGTEVNDYVGRFCDWDDNLLSDDDAVREAALDMIDATQAGRVEALPALAELTGVPYDTLIKAAKSGRIQGRKSGGTWLSTVEAVRAAINTGRIRPR